MKSNLSNLINVTKVGLRKNSPTILTVLGIAGMVGTVVLAVKATPKALEQIHEAEGEKAQKELRENPDADYEDTEMLKLTPVETVKATWKTYLPVVLTGAASGACILGANSINIKRNAALAATCQLTASSLNEYKRIVNATVDEDTKKVIKDKVATKQIEKNPVTKKVEKELRDQEVIVDGSSLCYDTAGNLYFRSNRNAIQEAVNIINKRMNGGEPYVSLNDLYYELGLRGTDLGYRLGWNLYRDDLIEVDCRSSMIASNGEPCIVVEFSVDPTEDYHRMENVF